MAALWALTLSVNLAGSRGLGRARTPAVRKSLSLRSSMARWSRHRAGCLESGRVLYTVHGNGGKGAPRWRVPKTQGRAPSEAGHHAGGEGTGQAQPPLPS